MKTMIQRPVRGLFGDSYFGSLQYAMSLPKAYFNEGEFTRVFEGKRV